MRFALARSELKRSRIFFKTKIKYFLFRLKDDAIRFLILHNIIRYKRSSCWEEPLFAEMYFLRMRKVPVRHYKHIAAQCTQSSNVLVISEIFLKIKK